MLTPTLPDRARLVKIIEALLNGTLQRNEVDAWWKDLQAAGGPNGPWLYGPPISNKEGYWEFLTLADVAERDAVGEFVLRDLDLRELLAELRFEPGQPVDGFELWRAHQLVHGLLPQCWFSVTDPEQAVEQRLPLPLCRAVIDDLGDLREHLCFKLSGTLFRVEHLRKTPRVLEFFWVPTDHDHAVGPCLDALDALVTRLELDANNVETIETKPVLLERQDANGNVFFIRRYDKSILALCERAALERKGHRQVYSVRFEE